MNAAEDQQLARGERRYRRKVASPKQWQAIIAAKGDACRYCSAIGSRGGEWRGPLEYHHLVSRSHGGDDVADNIIPLHHLCHQVLHGRFGDAARKCVLGSLTDAEYSYMVTRAGENYVERVYGVRYER